MNEGELPMKFMVKGTLKQAPTAEILALLPAEQARVHQLLEQGLVEALYVAADQSGAWLVMQGESQAGIQAVLSSLPLHQFAAYEITALAEEAA